MCDQFPFHGIQVHVLEFINEFRLTPDVKIVKARLPELWQEIVRILEGESELLGRCLFPRLAAQSPRNALLQDLHDGGRRALSRLANEQVNVIGHHDIAREGKPVTVTNLAQNLHEHILGARRGKQRQSPVTAARNEVQVAQSVATPQAFRHDRCNQKPRPCKSRKDRAPQVQNLNPEFTYRSSIREWSRDDFAERKAPATRPTTR
jgi:hypothetical protein